MIDLKVLIFQTRNPPLWGARNLESAISRERNYFGWNICMAVRDYKTELLKQLKAPSEAAAYLTACYEDSEEVFLAGLRNVVDAHGGVRAVAKTSELNRENLYRLLSERGNPRLTSLEAVLSAVGIKLQFAPRGKRRVA